MADKIFGYFDKGAIYTEVATFKNHGETREALAKMAQNRGRSFSDSVELADQVMAGVAAYEDLREAVEADPGKTLERFYKKLDKKEPAERALFLDQVLFGLECATNDELYVQAANAGKDLYKKMRGETPNLRSEEELKAAIQAKADNLSLSPLMLKELSTRLLVSSDYTATATALGRDGFALKCVTAMHLYLTAEDPNVDYAVLTACTSVDMQALGDAVEIGLVTEKVAYFILSALLLLATIILGSIFFGIGLEVGSFAGILIAALGFSLTTEILPLVGEPINRKISVALGNLAVLIGHLVREGCAAVKAGYEKIHAYAAKLQAAQAEEPAEDCEVVEEDDVVFDPDPDLAF